MDAELGHVEVKQDIIDSLLDSNVEAESGHVEGQGGDVHSAPSTEPVERTEGCLSLSHQERITTRKYFRP